MKKILSLLIFLLFLTSCSREPEKIKIGFNTWPGYEAVAIADQKHFFVQQGLEVDVKQYKYLRDVMDAFANREIDVMFSTTNEVLLLANQDQKLKIVMVADYSNGADSIVAQKNISSLKNLKGKKIGVPLNSVSHFLLLKALQKANLSEQEVTLVDVKEDEAIKQFTAKSLDAITTWQPYATAAIQSGGHIIFSSKEIPGQIVDVMSIRNTILEKKPEVANKLVTAYFNTLDWWRENTDEGIKIMASAANMSESDFKAALSEIKITNLKENLTAIGTPTKKGTLYAATQAFIDFLVAKKILAQPISADELIDPNPILNDANIE